ncbi:hypothetical protein [Campylobacter hyointestinalis]|uniref:Septum formation initiator n=2 Tax=Campylobacter hyointestinalis TaxID=198 RepID=A0AAV6EDJ3_CAMHY|nr:hypothetical protein [Campylobacter hyointestinalis]KAB0612501.1 hypothetical protein F7P66_06690 [Campylobacter hyointestinalis subsp. lawsonii]QKF68954.1 hypothetical protein CHLWT_0342 [Campylobacter hyointestinalis subsp. lawsonii]RAZ26086.1 hypothetical protein CHL9752_01460 [Campylobacter hyointestinalis subsp. lawsonii]RAZ29475.1 hypothetical protein CHLT_01245 [Campylobacter hyointestinalis subsp. lawsonii]RAZ39808.1 hypothetical protein CHL9426_02450 [Campylobacter hyointestinalis 
MNDKEQLLQSHDEYQKTEHNLSVRSLFIAYLILLLILAVALPKIYIANEIYYTSRDIAELRNKLNVLLEENKELKSKLEKIRYKNQIIDNMSY